VATHTTLKTRPRSKAATATTGSSTTTDARLIHGDCLDVLRKIKSGSVDAIVTDPPYGQTNESYDGPIAFSPDLWRECARVCKPNAACISFAGSPTYHKIASGIEAGGWKVRQMWGWVYRNGMITSAWPKEGFDRLAPAMDPICYATRGKMLLNCERVGDNAWRVGETTRLRNTLSERSKSHGAKSGVGHYPRSIASDGCPDFEYFALSRVGCRKSGVTGHPNQKPLELLEWIVSKLPPGGVILDPFCGSGTTGVAAVELGHSFIGIEQHSEYVDVSRKRIAAALASISAA
jgi:site-specific DNA-methyltransferase (adenine-specific)